MTPMIFGIVLSAIVAIALVLTFILLSREERFAVRSYKLQMRELQVHAIMNAGSMFSDAKELTFEELDGDRMTVKVSRRDHAPLPPQYITPTIVAPQALYGGGATRMQVLTGMIDDFYASDCQTGNQRKKVKNTASSGSDSK
jgi:hypothetical protein